MQNQTDVQYQNAYMQAQKLLVRHVLAAPLVRQVVLIVGLIIGALTAGCGAYGGSKSSSSSGSSGSSDLTQAVDCGSPAALDDERLAALPLDGSLPDLRHVPAASLWLTMPAKNGSAAQRMTLCDVLKSSGKQLLVLQFVSVKCYTCMKWVEQVNTDVAGQNLTSNVLNVAVVVDPQSEVSDSDLWTMQSEVAPAATWVRDTDQSLWNFFSTANTADSPVTPLSIVMDWAERGFYCDQQLTPLATLVSVADQLMGWTIGQGSGTATPTATSTAGGTATATATTTTTATATATATE